MDVGFKSKWPAYESVVNITEVMYRPWSYGPGKVTKPKQEQSSFARREQRLWAKLCQLADERRVRLALSKLEGRAAERRRIYLCHRETRELCEEVLMRSIARKMQIQAADVLPRSALCQLKSHLRLLQIQRRQQLQRRVAMLEKLLSEEKYRQRLLHPPVYRPLPRVTKQEEQQAPTMAESVEEEEILLTVEEEEEEEKLQEVELEVKAEEHAGKKGKKGKKGKEGKEKKKEKKGKGKKKQVEEPPPLPPVLRRQVQPEQEVGTFLTGPLSWVPPLAEDVAAIRPPPPTPLLSHPAFKWTPSRIDFKGFSKGEHRTLLVRLQNTSYLPARYLLLEPELNDVLWLQWINLQPQPDEEQERLLRPGDTLNIRVDLNVPDDAWPLRAVVQGHLRVLVLRRGADNQQYMLLLPITCEPEGAVIEEPTPAQPNVSPLLIDFGTHRCWTASGLGARVERHLTLGNTGGTTCIASIQPLEELLPPPAPPNTETEASTTMSPAEEEVEEEEEHPKAKGRKGKKEKGGKKKKKKKRVQEEEIPEPPDEAELLRAAAIEATEEMLEQFLRDATAPLHWACASRYLRLEPHSTIQLPLVLCASEPGAYRQDYIVSFWEDDGRGGPEDLIIQIHVTAVGRTTALPLRLEPRDGLFLGAAWASSSVIGGPLQQVFHARLATGAEYCALPLTATLSPPAAARYLLSSGAVKLLPAGPVVIRSGTGYSGCAEFLLRINTRKRRLVEAARRAGVWVDRLPGGGVLRGLAVEVRAAGAIGSLGAVPPLSIPVQPLSLCWPDHNTLHLRLGKHQEPGPWTCFTQDTLVVTAEVVSRSHIPLNFVILGLQPGVMVDPRQGTVLAGEEMPVNVVLSPRAGLHVKLGGQDTWTVRLRVAATQQLVDKVAVKHGAAGTPEDELEQQLQSEERQVDEEDYEEDDQKEDKEDNKEGDKEDDKEFDEKSKTQSDSTGTVEKPRTPELKKTKGDSLELEVVVIDPRCSLSCTRLLLPPTSLDGETLATVRLLGHNPASQEWSSTFCRCRRSIFAPGPSPGPAWHQGRFDVVTDCSDLLVMPNRGTIEPGKEESLYLSFRPRMNKAAIRVKAKEIRDKKLEEERLLEESEGKKSKKGKKDKKRNKSKESKKSKTSKKSKKSTSRASSSDEEPYTEEELKNAEVELLSNREPTLRTCIVRLRVVTTDRYSQRSRPELLRLVVWGAVCRPTVLLMAEPKMEFGPTAAGTCRRLSMDVYAFEDVKVKVEAMEPTSSFWPPYSALAPLEMKTGDKIPLAVCYRPPVRDVKEPLGDKEPSGDEETSGDEEPSHDLDRLVLRAGRSSACVVLSGRRVEPVLIQKPVGITVWRSQGAAGKPTDCASIELKNGCEAPLDLQLVQDGVLQGPDLPPEPDTSPPTPSSDTSKSSKKTKGSKKEKGEKSKGGKSKGGKSKGKKGPAKQSAELLPQEELELQNLYTTKADPELFAVTPPEGRTLQPGEKCTFKVKFTAPAPLVTEEPAKKSKKSKGKKGTSVTTSSPRSPKSPKSDQPPTVQEEPQPVKYVALYSIMLGKIVKIQSFYFFTTVKGKERKEGKEKKNKKDKKKK